MKKSIRVVGASDPRELVSAVLETAATSGDLLPSRILRYLSELRTCDLPTVCQVLGRIYVLEQNEPPNVEAELFGSRWMLRARRPVLIEAAFDKCGSELKLDVSSSLGGRFWPRGSETYFEGLRRKDWSWVDVSNPEGVAGSIRQALQRAAAIPERFAGRGTFETDVSKTALISYSSDGAQARLLLATAAKCLEHFDRRHFQELGRLISEMSLPLSPGAIAAVLVSAERMAPACRPARFLHDVRGLTLHWEGEKESELELSANLLPDANGGTLRIQGPSALLRELCRNSVCVEWLTERVAPELPEDE